MPTPSVTAPALYQPRASLLIRRISASSAFSAWVQLPQLRPVPTLPGVA